MPTVWLRLKTLYVPAGARHSMHNTNSPVWHKVTGGEHENCLRNSCKGPSENLYPISTGLGSQGLGLGDFAVFKGRMQWQIGFSINRTKKMRKHIALFL